MTAQATPPPFSDPQWSQLRQWLETLDERQRWWLSGYLAAASSAPAAVAGTEGTQPVLIGYGTETDNCRHLARTLSEHCGDAGIATEVVDLARLRPRQLARRDHLVIITATHGDGDPPEPIQDFYQGLMGDGAPQLANLKFAVLALGDSSYERFCVTGQEFDQRLEALGGERLIARQDCDVDFEQPARDWIARLLEKLPKANTTGTAQGPARAPTSSPPSYDKHHPLTVEVLVNQNLSAADRAQPIHHLELALDQAIPDLFPGDAVGILADNPPELVAAVLDACELSGEQPVTVNDDAQPLVQALRQTRDLTIAGTGFLAFWAEQSQAPALLELCQAESRRQRAFLRDHQLLDLLHQYPAHPPAQALVNALRPLQPRLYDVANSLAVLDDELHLTVKAFHYPFRERHEQGIASRYLLDLQPGDPVRLYPHRNARFRLPDDDAPLILIAEGTGIAPYRAFLQALSQQSQRPPCWLVFAEQRFEDDFLYQLDIQQARADGVLERVDTVFYQDQPGAGLITPLLDQIDRLGTWIDRGAHLYLCGDKGRLSDLESGLKTALDQRQGDGAWKQLGREMRLHRNLY